MPAAPMPFRQIHLDFHTSPDIPAVAADFDAGRFADRLARAHVNSVTIFARCHHGYLYYPTQAHPERVHPTLQRPNLLVEQIEALHARGIRCPIYTTVQWDEFTANEHPEWLHLDADGTVMGTKPFEPGFYRFLDVSHPGYRAFLEAHVADLFDCLPTVDGIFFDIVQARPSVAPHWIAGMDAAGHDPESPTDRAAFAQRAMDAWKLEMTRFVHERSVDCSVFYNAGHIGPHQRGGLDAYTHLEIESLPSGGWGYMHFPTTASYVRSLGKPSLGMTGKFHTQWGDFHSYKNPAALEFECFKMLAYGSACSVGDQLHPRGELDDATYDLIGGVYGSVEAKEPWCVGTRPVAEVAVLSAEEFEVPGQGGKETGAARGAVRLLEELGVQFDTVDSSAPLDGYRAVVMPDAIEVDDALAGRLAAFVEAGGAILASGRSGLDHEAFSRDVLGVRLVGDAAWSPDFLVPGALDDGLPDTGHAMYLRGVELEALPGTEVLSQVQRPYFNRTWRHFCSHMHAPSNFETAYPGVAQRGRAITFAHPVFSQYDASAPRWCKTLVDNALRRLIGGRLVEHDGPSTASVHLLDQPAEGRYVLHALHYVPVRKGEIDVIEDRVPLNDLRLTLRLPRPATSAEVVPDGGSVSIQDAGDGAQRLTLPVVNGHAMVALRYGS